MADRTIKPDSGNDLVLQNNGGGTKIEIPDSGDIALTGTIGSGTFNGTIGSSAIFPASHSVQVVSSTQAGEINFLTSTPTAVSNLTKSITLKTDAPNILVILAINSGGKAFSNTALGINLTADSDTALNIQLTDMQGYTGDTGTSFSSAVQVFLHELTSNDTAGDTITYTPKFFSAANSTQAGINGVYSTNDATSQIILMELTT